MEVRKYLKTDVPDLGRRIKEAREKDRRSAQVLATLAGISTGYWYQIEKEERKWISLDVVREIEKVLGVNLNVSFAGDDSSVESPAEPQEDNDNPSTDET